MSKLTTNRDSVTALSITQPTINLINETRLKHLRISIIEPWGDIISGYKTISQILDKRNAGSNTGANNNSNDKNVHAKTGFSIYNIRNTNASTNVSNMICTKDVYSTGGMDNNMDKKNTYSTSFSIYNVANINASTCANNISDTRDTNGNNSADNNFANKNIYIKAGFSNYNIIDANADVDDISGMRDAGGTGSANNNADNQNAHTKAGFNIYNITVRNANNISDTDNKISNNIINIDVY